MVAFTADAVARIAAPEMTRKPTFPSTASPASASTCPASCCIFATLSRPTTRVLTTRYTTATMARALNIARGSSLFGCSISPEVFVTTPKP